MPLADTLNRKPGDILKSDDWNVIIKEIDRKINRDGADTLNGPLTIAEALNANSNVTIKGSLSIVVPQPQDPDGQILGLGPTDASNLRLGYHQDYSWIQSHGGKPLLINRLGNNIGIGSTINPVAKLDIASATRTGTHPTAVKGLYITGDFNSDNDGVEFRHSNGTQGIGFGFNTIYAAGSNPNQDLGLKPKGTGEVKVAGNLSVTGLVNCGNLSVTGSVSSGSLSVTGSVSFGVTGGQMLNLWLNIYGIGIQNSTQYFRTGSNFAWYKGGSHNDAELNPGGGTSLMTLDANGKLSVSGDLSVTNVLEIGDPPFGGNTCGNRDWMQKGIKINWDSDSLFIGLKNEGTNRKDAVIAWGDDPQDDLRFVNVLSGGDVQGKELMRIKPSGNVGIGTNPVASLDIASAARTGTHPTAVKGLYITGDFNPDNDGVEFRHSNGTQGIGFGFNTIYAAGSAANQDLALKPKGTGEVKVAGNLSVTGLVNCGNLSVTGSVSSGNLSVTGSVSFGSQVRQMLNLWSTNYGIGVQSSTQYFRSDANFAWYKGGSHNDGKLNAGGGTSLMTLDRNGNLSVSGIVEIGSLQLGGFTSEDKDEWPNVFWCRDLNQNWEEGLIKHSSSRGVFQKAGFGIHFHQNREFGLWSTNWNPLFAVDGSTGNTYIRGNLKVNGAITPSVGNSENNGIMFPKDPGGGGGDAAWIRYYVRGGEATTFEIGTSNDSDDHIALMPNAGNVGIGTNNPTKAKVHIEGSISYTQPGGYRYMNRATVSEISSYTMTYSLYASNAILASEFNAFSDERIKEIYNRSDSQEDLKTLLQIEVTDYSYRDKIAKGNGKQKKVIGQQIAKVFPQAVSTNTDVVCDIFQFATLSDGWVTLTNHGLKTGERVKLIWGEDKSEIFTIEAVTPDTFQIDLDYCGDILVYGREVNDFHVVDYTALSMLHISATQELYKIIKKLEEKINEKVKG